MNIQWTFLGIGRASARLALSAAVLALSTACSGNLPLPYRPAGQAVAETAAITPQPVETATEPASTSPGVQRLHLPFVPAEGPRVGLQGSVPTATPHEVDPHIEVEARPMVLHQGEFVTVVATPIDIGLPIYELYIRDEGVPGDPVPVLRLSYENKLEPQAGTTRVLAVESSFGGPGEARFFLKAVEVGSAEVWVNATGEIHYGYPGPATWGGGSSIHWVITVLE